MCVCGRHWATFSFYFKKVSRVYHINCSSVDHIKRFFFDFLRSRRMKKAPWGTREGKQPVRRLPPSSADASAKAPPRVPGAFLEWAAKPTFSFDEVYLPLVGEQLAGTHLLCRRMLPFFLFMVLDAYDIPC